MLKPFTSREMNAQQPPLYNPPVPDDQDEDVDKTSVLCSRLQSFFILAVLAITIAELVLAVKSRGLAHNALGTAQMANETASSATDQVSLSRAMGR